MAYTKDDMPFVTGSDTSEAAAHDALPAAKRHFFTIRQSIAAAPDGMTCDEVEVALGLKHQTASARIRDLVMAEMVYDTGARRPTRSGSMARVYSAHAIPRKETRP